MSEQRLFVAPQPDPQATRRCINCGEVQPLGEFPKRTSTTDVRRNQCRTCVYEGKKRWDRANPESRRATKRRRYWEDHEASKARARMWNQANPERRLDTHLRRAFGITLDEWNRIWTQQGGVCAACRRPETAIDKRTGKVRRLHVDHDHSTGAVRGLLCVLCNVAVGYLKDDPMRAEMVRDYLVATKANPAIPTPSAEVRTQVKRPPDPNEKPEAYVPMAQLWEGT